MLRVMGLALLLVVGGAAPAAGNDSGRGGKAMAVTPQQGAAAPGEGSLLEQRTPAVRATSAWTTAPRPTHESGAGLHREVVDQPDGLALLAPEPRQRAASSVLPWVGHAKPGLRLPLTERLSVVVGYERVQGEDLWRRYAEAGSVDYDSHDFLLRAYWRF
jgi:hypothetical protein